MGHDGTPPARYRITIRADDAEPLPPGRGSPTEDGMIAAKARPRYKSWGTIVPTPFVSYWVAARTIRVARAADRPENSAPPDDWTGGIGNLSASQPGPTIVAARLQVKWADAARCHDGCYEADVQMEIRAEPDRSVGPAREADAPATARSGEADAPGGCTPAMGLNGRS